MFTEVKKKCPLSEAEAAEGVAGCRRRPKGGLGRPVPAPLAHCGPPHASGSLLRRATCQCFSLTARGAHCKRLITAFPDQASPLHLCTAGRGEGARCSDLVETRRVNPSPQPQQSSFQKTRAWRPRTHPLGTALRTPPPVAPPNPRAGGGVGVAGRLRTSGASGPARSRERAGPAAAENGSGCERIAVIG